MRQERTNLPSVPYFRYRQCPLMRSTRLFQVFDREAPDKRPHQKWLVLCLVEGSKKKKKKD